MAPSPNQQIASRLATVKNEQLHCGPPPRGSAGSSVLLCEKEAAQLLGFSCRTLQKWRGTGGGPKFVKVSARAIRYREEDLLGWITDRVRFSTSDVSGVGVVK